MAQRRFSEHTCENCGCVFQSAGGYPWKKPKTGKYHYYCSDDCMHGINYKPVMDSALFTAQFWYKEYCKHMRSYYSCTWINDDGGFTFLAGNETNLEKAKNDMYNCEEALILFREYRDRVRWQESNRIFCKEVAHETG